jgi:AcrR family transcriptional regulator
MNELNQNILDKLNSKECQYGQGKDVILATAIRLFSSKGFKQTTLKNISAECGMNSALISYYFGGKKGLLKAVLNLKLDNFNKMFEPVYTKGKDIELKDMKDFILRVLENCEQDPSILHISQWSLIDKEESSTKFTQDVCSIAENRIAESLCYLNPKLDESKAMARVLMIGSMLQKYTELFWSYPNYRNFSLPTNEMQSLFKEQIINMLEPIIFRD